MKRLLSVAALMLLGVSAWADSHFDALRARAEAGDAQAQVEVAAAYQSGKGVARSFVQAVSWYERAAERGRGDAMFNMAVLYYNGGTLGDSFPEDIPLAYKWLLLADAYGEPQAAASLNEIGGDLRPERAAALRREAAEMILTGTGVPQNSQLGLQVLERAADAGDLTSHERLAGIYMEGKYVPRDAAKARNLCAKLAAMDEAAGWFCEGRVEEESAGQTQRALELYEKAALRTHALAAWRAARRYRDGLPGVPPDHVKAAAYFYVAYKYGGFNEAAAEGNVVFQGLDKKRQKKTARLVASIRPASAGISGLRSR